MELAATDYLFDLQDNPPAANPFGSLNVDWGALKTAVSSVKAPEPAAQNPGYYTGAVSWQLDITLE